MMPSTLERQATEVHVERRGPTRQRAPLAVAAAFLLVVAAQAGAILALNVVVDPRGEFGTGLFQPISTWSEERDKMVLLAALPEPPTTLVLGSSRVMKIAPSDIAALGHGPAFNLGLSASTLNDIRATFADARATQGDPARVILGVDSDRLLASRDDRWAEPRPYADLTPAEYGRRLAASYSLSYVWDTLNVIRYNIVGYPPKSVTIDPDGLYHYVDWEARTPRPLPDPLAMDRAIRVHETLYADATLDDARIRNLAAFVQEARAADIEVVVFLTPLHPDLRARLESATPYPDIRAAALDALSDLCAPGVRVHDLESIDSFGGSADDFKDPVHYGPDNARAIVGTLFEQPGICPG